MTHTSADKNQMWEKVSTYKKRQLGIIASGKDRKLDLCEPTTGMKRQQRWLGWTQEPQLGLEALQLCYIPGSLVQSAAGLKLSCFPLQIFHSELRA